MESKRDNEKENQCSILNHELDLLVATKVARNGNLMTLTSTLCGSFELPKLTEKDNEKA
ncbi:MAG: hypothetical protein IPF63_13650 [Bacteroidetes bacterium]|nr:hypothetical protein [Bacteroidota bacterium]